jgi:hypothetical protein
MNLKKGFNRIFILLALGASLFGFASGAKYTENTYDKSKIFKSFNWSKENINQYYLTAEKVAKRNEEEEMGQPKYLRTREEIEAELNGMPSPTLKDLPNYKKSPPQYNEYIFARAFPEAVITPAYYCIGGGVLGALLAFCLCYFGLHLSFFLIKWIINGFKR